jgi:putative membrane protein
MARWLSILGLLGASVAPAFAQTPDTDPAWFWRYGWGMGGMMFGGGLFMLVFWGGIILLAVLLVRWLGGVNPPDSRQPRRQTPLEILQERYARGEIDKQEYDERKRTLMTD